MAENADEVLARMKAVLSGWKQGEVTLARRRASPR
jgi:hypothetical protein